MMRWVLYGAILVIVGEAVGFGVNQSFIGNWQLWVIVLALQVYLLVLTLRGVSWTLGLAIAVSWGTQLWWFPLLLPGTLLVTVAWMLTKPWRAWRLTL